MARPLEIACLQTRPMPAIEAALGEAMPLAERAASAGADFLFLPEYCGGLVSEGPKLVPPAADENDHPFLVAMQEFAAERRVWIMIGSVAIKGPQGRIFNRGFVIDDNGRVRSRYDKIHMFDIQLSEQESYRESASVNPGDSVCLVETPFASIGHTICYDLRFPKLYRELAQGGAEIICVPAAFTKRTGEAHWHVLNRARAIENGVFVISPCAVGPIPGGGESYGHSIVVGPWGEVLADGGTLHGVVQATIDLEKVEAARQRIPSLSHDRKFTGVTDGVRSVA